MLFNAQLLAVATLFSTLANGLPLDSRDIHPRAKSYDVINVDGGSPTRAPTQDTTTIEVTATVTGSTSATTTSSASRSLISTTTSYSISTASITSSPSSSISEPTVTPKPIFVTVTVPIEGGPTDYYDDGLWHTRYPIKSFEAAVATSV